MHLLKILGKTLKEIFTSKHLPLRVEPPYTHIVQIGDPVLRTRAYNVEREDIAKLPIQKALRIMLELVENDKLVGISAPQIGLPFQIMVFQCNQNILLKLFTRKELEENEIPSIPPQVFINPEMRILDYDTNVGPEMCGSVLGYKAEIKRYNSVSIVGLDALGKQRHMEATGFLARIIQHEMDHLNGVLFTDLMDPALFRSAIWKEVNQVGGYAGLYYYPRARNK